MLFWSYELRNFNCKTAYCAASLPLDFWADLLEPFVEQGGPSLGAEEEGGMLIGCILSLS